MVILNKTVHGQTPRSSSALQNISNSSLSLPKSKQSTALSVKNITEHAARTKLAGSS